MASADCKKLKFLKRSGCPDTTQKLRLFDWNAALQKWVISPESSCKYGLNYWRNTGDKMSFGIKAFKRGGLSFEGELLRASPAQLRKSLPTSSAPFSRFLPGSAVCDLAPGTLIKELPAVLDKQ